MMLKVIQNVSHETLVLGNVEAQLPGCERKGRFGLKWYTSKSGRSFTRASMR